MASGSGSGHRGGQRAVRGGQRTHDCGLARRLRATGTVRVDGRGVERLGPRERDEIGRSDGGGEADDVLFVSVGPRRALPVSGVDESKFARRGKKDGGAGDCEGSCCLSIFTRPGSGSR